MCVIRVRPAVHGKRAVVGGRRVACGPREGEWVSLLTWPINAESRVVTPGVPRWLMAAIGPSE